MGKEEIWVEVTGFPNYEVSNRGRIKSKDTTLKRKSGYVYKHGKMLNGSQYKGYVTIKLVNGDIRVNKYLHRIVAEHFIENPLNKPYINHIDNNPMNNDADNLEWCTPKENTAWMVKQGGNKRTKEWLRNLHKSQKESYKPVIAEKANTGEKTVFRSLNSVKTKGFSPSTVCKCCKGPFRDMQHKGYYFYYKEDSEDA